MHLARQNTDRQTQRSSRAAAGPSVHSADPCSTPGPPSSGLYCDACHAIDQQNVYFVVYRGILVDVALDLPNAAAAQRSCVTSATSEPQHGGKTMAIKLKQLQLWLCLWLVIPALALAGCAAIETPKPEPAIERIALFQMAPLPGDFPANHQLLEEALRLAAAEGATIFVTPELAESGYEFAEVTSLPELPEYPSPWLSQLAVRAKETQMTLFIGFPQRSGQLYYNAVAAISRQGHLAGVHQKVDIIPSPDEAWATPGDTRPITVDGLTIGYFICADAANAELIQAYKNSNPDLLLSSAAWYPDPEMGPEPFWQQVSADIEAPFFIANTTGHKGEIDFSDSSSAVYQGGQPLYTLNRPDNSLYLFDWHRQSGQIELLKTLPVEAP